MARATPAVSGSSSIAFGYDNDDLFTSAGALTLRRDATNGLLTGTTLGNLVDTYGYNPFGEMTEYSVQLSGSPILAFRYTRDDAGRIAMFRKAQKAPREARGVPWSPLGVQLLTGAIDTSRWFADGSPPGGVGPGPATSDVIFFARATLPRGRCTCARKT